MSKLNTAKIDEKGFLSVNKDNAEELVIQDCPYSGGRCGLWCPRCYITEKKIVTFGNKSKTDRTERTVHTCGGSYELL